MKLSITTSSFLLPSITAAYSMRGYDMWGRPVFIRGQPQPCTGPSWEARGRRQSQERQQQQQADVEEAFDNLKNDLTGASSEEAINKTKKMVGRSFEFLSDMNREAAMSEEQAAENEEMLRTQQKWANKIIDYAAELGQDLAELEPPRQVTQKNEPFENVKANTNDMAVPIYSLQNNDSVFQVELELPGVNLDDIDIQLKEEINVLVISGGRQSIGSNVMTKFSKSFVLDPMVETDRISAKLVNGILTVIAPKKLKQDEADKTKKIPVVVG